MNYSTIIKTILFFLLIFLTVMLVYKAIEYIDDKYIIKDIPTSILQMKQK